MQPPRKATNPSMKRRSYKHDYSAPGAYMLTLTVADRKPLLGRLVEGPIPAIEHTPLGKAIIDNEVRKISRFYPNVKVWAVMVMPDHIHIIVGVVEAFPKGKHLGSVVYGFKVGCTRASWRQAFPCGESQGTQGGLPLLFEDGYNDKILKYKGHLDVWKRYIADNPRRLAVKRLHPDYFTVMHNLEICGRNCRIVGNRFLLDIPDKMAVIVHRADTDEDYRRHCRDWMECGERGGVLVGAFISPREKAVRGEAIRRGYNLISLQENGFPPLYKPSGHLFDLCAEGRLLQISPWEYHNEQHRISRAQCLELNALAERIAQSR